MADGVAAQDNGVSDGIRTRDPRDHNAMLYRLSYTHRGCPPGQRGLLYSLSGGAPNPPTPAPRGTVRHHGRVITPRTCRPPLLRSAAALAGLLALLCAQLVVSAPASAHARLEKTSPADGASLTAAPPEIMLGFNEVVNEDLSEVTVQTGSTDVTDGSVDVEGDSLYQPLRSDMPEGEYTVTYKVVSADGHPVSGTFTFSYAPPKGGEEDSGASSTSTNSSSTGGSSTSSSTSAGDSSPSDSSSSSSSQGAEPSGTSSTSEAGAPASNEDSGVPGWIWGVGALGVILVIAAITLLARGRRSTSEEEDIDLDDDRG